MSGKDLKGPKPTLLEKLKADNDADLAAAADEREKEAKAPPVVSRLTSTARGKAPPSQPAGPSVHVPQEVKDAVSLCLKSMLTGDLSYTASKEARATLERAVDYWSGCRVAAAGPYMPEVALGCAIVGAATIEVRRKQAIATGKMQDDSPKGPPVAPSASGAADPKGPGGNLA